MIRLYLKHKAEILKEYYTKRKEVKIGRSKKNNIVINDKQVSQKHCILRKTEEGYEVEDLNTSFGTSIKGRKISKENISFNDEIQIGEHSIKLVKSSADDNKAFLIGIQGRMDGRKFELNAGETKIGRSEEFNDIWISKDVDRSVSRRHATISCDGKKYILTDKRSRNRTFVNQRQVNEDDEVHLKENDEILIGKSIFRFIIGENEKYSYPKRAGIFWTRIFPKVRVSVFLLACAAGAYLLYKGLQGLIIIGDRPAEYSLVDSGWRPEGLSTYEDGYLTDDVLDITPSPAIGDVTGDGANEVVMAAPNGEIYTWSAGGKLLWYQELGQQSLTSPQLADVNGNRVNDIIVGSDDSRVYVIDGRTGHLIYRSSFLGGKVLSASSILVSDLEMNGFKDIVAVTDDKIVSFIYSPLMGEKRPYHFRTGEEIMSSPVLFENNNTGYVAVPTNGGKIYLFEAANPENRSVIDFTERINMHGGLNLVLNEINTIPAVADLNNDGEDKLICAAGSYFMAPVAGDGSKSLSWLYRIEPYSSLEPPLRYASPVVGDFSGNGLPDVAIAWANGNILAVDGRNGRELWKFSLRGQRNRIIASMALADFNKDGMPDPVVASEDGAVFIIDGSGGGDEAVLARIKMDSPVTATPAIADITGDGYIDIAVVSVDGDIRIFKTPVKVFKNEVIWPCFRNTADNKGALFYDDKKEVHTIFAGVGILIIVGIGLTQVLIKRKRKKKRPPKVKV